MSVDQLSSQLSTNSTCSEERSISGASAASGGSQVKPRQLSAGARRPTPASAPSPCHHPPPPSDFRTAFTNSPPPPRARGARRRRYRGMDVAKSWTGTEICYSYAGCADKFSSTRGYMENGGVANWAQFSDAGQDKCPYVKSGASVATPFKPVLKRTFKAASQNLRSSESSWQKGCYPLSRHCAEDFSTFPWKLVALNACDRLVVVAHALLPISNLYSLTA